MRILAVDTTGAHGSVALLDGRELRGIIGIATDSPRHAERLLPSIDDLLARLGMELDRVEGFAVAVGPGGFTGLRIGIAAVEGLSFATGRPAAGISALEATAYRHRRLDGILVSFIEAYRGEIYGAVYRAASARISPLSEPVCQPPEEFLDSLPGPPAIVAGTGILRHRAHIVSRFGEAVLAEPSFFLAEEVGLLGLGRLEAGRGASLGALEALYIRPSEAERNRAAAAAPARSE
jgi:tRNA threonylcarbamoyladenosine biosynthesis protein TsaB